jgi:hypothetical protein
MTTKIRQFLGTAGMMVGLALLLGNVCAKADDLSSLTAEWWQWALSIPTTVSPLEDTTGENCVVGQRGPIWFLAGSFLGGTATRRCNVPEGVALFFPVSNSVNFNTPNVCGQGQASIPVKDLRATSAAFIDGVTNMGVDLDGKPLRDFKRTQSQVFPIALPADNVFNSLCGGPGTVPAGIYSPGVDDGFYVWLNPLKPGSHNLHFHAENSGQGFVIDMTYQLTVVPVSSKD